MTRKFFGTDGVRGRANEEPITAATALALAMAAGARFRHPGRHGLAVIGKDTRLSGYMLEPAMTAGFLSVGMDVVLLGPLPTPAVGMLTRSMRADLGVMISASHNPFDDNGIKLFGPDGFKLSDEEETAIEAAMNTVADLRVPGESLGRARRLDDAYGRYLEFIKGSFPRNLQLDGLKIVVDCAHGAAYKVAPTVLFELGAEVIALGVQPNGFNINQDCGATATAALQERVVAEGADLGIALDGDADRVILVDERGQRIDGDQVMALIGSYWHRAERLHGPGVVATVMSNLGLERHLQGLGVELLRTPVGDRYVVERMRAEGCNLGGEQSGHLIFSDYSTTGDGLIAALQVLAVLVGSGRPASEVLAVFEPYPQLLRNVRFRAGTQPLEQPAVDAAIQAAKSALGEGGRLLIRKSGTEPLVRVMGEGKDADLVRKVVEELAGCIEEAAAAPA
ncbi:phosphoglucosamine mutase [Aquibaculum arenosum]|uniref:Phosphoglucosamine mutase n=1 Tax=Aquibaculum arenosum TaxID=3032591 RepID=A0ABT5YIF7_9PROT|nr:phosphoglucosamine mutase [Fodinicurvata sp. CAU 1616]MDF2094727.1 phosphoglucosamine mutase [Fodinicurvata sp. CAU 1616]